MHAEIDLWIKIAYSAMLLVIVPVYAVYWGWRNFLWFSDIALITTGIALWLENSLLASMMALAVLVPELLWNASYFVRLIFGIRVTDLAGYMFDTQNPRFIARCRFSMSFCLPSCSGCSTSWDTIGERSWRRRSSPGSCCRLRMR